LNVGESMFWFRLPPATKAPPPLPPPRCGGEWKETGRNWWVGIREFNRAANKGNRNNNDTNKEKIRHKLTQQTLSPGQDQRRALPSHE